MNYTTRKRALDRDPMDQVPNKRRRLNRYGKVVDVARYRAAGTTCQTDCDALNRSSSSSGFVEEFQLSQSADAGISTISPIQLSQNIRDAINRLHRCKQLSFSMRAVESMQDLKSDTSDMDVKWPPRRPDSFENLLFTFEDVQLICERTLKERENELREKYDEVLNNKLVEQYDFFAKFTHK
uniref:Akirin n=1 Tax=Glossina austeni TaxID=7395 RepID=A0A1A9VSZ4_GLOAU